MPRKIVLGIGGMGTSTHFEVTGANFSLDRHFPLTSFYTWTWIKGGQGEESQKDYDVLVFTLTRFGLVVPPVCSWFGLFMTALPVQPIPPCSPYPDSSLHSPWEKGRSKTNRETNKCICYLCENHGFKIDITPSHCLAHVWDSLPRHTALFSGQIWPNLMRLWT